MIECARCATPFKRTRKTDNRYCSVACRFSASYMADANTGCWLWTSHINRDGYSAFYVDGRLTEGHRASYEMHVGQIPAGLQLDHLCRVRNCVNPDHLEPVTHAENMRRVPKLTECKHGHSFTEANTYYRNGWRSCRACNRAAVARYTAKRKASA